MRRWQQRVVGVVVAMTTVACPDLTERPAPSADPAAVAAVDHVGDVLMAAGHEAPAVERLVSPRCGPADEFFGMFVTDAPVTLASIPWSDVDPVASVRGRVLPPAEPDPAAGAPAHVDRVEVDDDGWAVRWGESNATTTPDGAPATVVTVVGGGEVDTEVVRRWEAEGLLAEVWPCG